MNKKEGYPSKDDIANNFKRAEEREKKMLEILENNKIHFENRLKNFKDKLPTKEVERIKELMKKNEKKIEDLKK